MSSTFSVVSSANAALTLDSASRTALRQEAVPSSVGNSLAGASSVVELGAQPEEALTYPAALPRLQQVWTAGYGDDAVSRLIARNFNTGDRLRGLGAALLEGYKGEAGTYRQALLSFTGVPGSAAAEQAQQVADLELQVAPTQRFSMTLKTQSGATVELSVASRANGLGVELKSSQTLTGNELKAVQDLAEGFEAAVKGLTEQPPKIAIDALSRFDSRAIVSLDLNASFSKEGGQLLSLAFSATSAGRSLSVKTQTGKLDLNVDLSNSQIRGDRAQRDKAMGNYLAQVDVAAKRGNGDKALVELFKNAFSEIHAYYPDDNNAVGRRPLRDYEMAALSGLADFKAGIEVTAVASNPMRPGEVDHFNYQSLQESILTTGSRTRLTQRQEMTLDAAFHRELRSDRAPMLTADPRSQNYRYFQVNDRIRSQVTIEHDELGPVLAQQEQSASKRTAIQTFERGKLTKEEEIPDQHSAIIDLLDTIKSLSPDPAERQRQLLGLNDQILLRN